LKHVVGVVASSRPRSINREDLAAVLPTSVIDDQPAHSRELMPLVVDAQASVQTAMGAGVP
jgi:hypothetical protein